jgi:hypothetical protein
LPLPHAAGSGLLVGLAGVANKGEVAQLTPLFLRAIDSFSIESTTLPAASDLNSAYTPHQYDIQTGFGVNCTNSTTSCSFEATGSATTGGSTSYTDTKSSTWGKVLQLGFSVGAKVSMKKSLSTSITTEVGVDGSVEGECFGALRRFALQVRYVTGLPPTTFAVLSEECCANEATDTLCADMCNSRFTVPPLQLP